MKKLIATVIGATMMIAGMATTPALAHDSGRGEGTWRPIHHNQTMNCFPRGSVPRGETMVRTCRGVTYRVIGGSLSTGAHRQAWVWVATPSGYWREIPHRQTMNCFPRGSVPRGETMIRTCGGTKFKVLGGSLSQNIDRRAWVWVTQ